jgi:hypothetical protein
VVIKREEPTVIDWVGGCFGAVFLIGAFSLPFIIGLWVIAQILNALT